MLRLMLAKVAAMLHMSRLMLAKEAALLLAAVDAGEKEAALLPMSRLMLAKGGCAAACCG